MGRVKTITIVHDCAIKMLLQAFGSQDEPRQYYTNMLFKCLDRRRNLMFKTKSGKSKQEHQHIILHAEY